MLAEKIRKIEQRLSLLAKETLSPDSRKHSEFVKTGWAEIDGILNGGLTPGLHEWLGLAMSQNETSQRKSNWTPTLSILVHLAWQCLKKSPSSWVVWIGRVCLPYPATLTRENGQDQHLLDRSLFVSLSDTATRLWAMDMTLRSPVVTAVIADGSKLDMAATRRLHLVAKTHRKTIVLARPFWELSELSAAQTRWRAAWKPSETESPRWSIKLMRCKGVLLEQSQTSWILELNRETGTLHLSSALADYAGDARATENKAATHSA
ncbi:MAG: hypothetical protein MI923_00635 [Phycisphaerales bacterium]|nr:hypothetical protein [Phycisphaerales bacterium]